MDASKDGYQPPLDYKEDSNDPLVEIPVTDSTELWLIQWSINQLQPEDFEGKELSLKLHHDGTMDSFESSSGKSYEVVSYAAQEPDATVFLASTSESKVVGKVSRRVCLVHYPEPGSMVEPRSNRPLRSGQGLSGSLMKNSDQFTTPSRSLMRRTLGTASRTQSSQQKSSMISNTSSIKGEPSKHSKRKHVDSPTASEVPSRSMDRSTQDSGREGRSSLSSLGYSDGNNSQGEKSKKKRKVGK